MANRVSQRMVRAFERFNTDLFDFLIQTDFSDLYEDAYTTRTVRSFKLALNGNLTWIEDGHKECEQMFDDDEARDFLSFWRGCLRRAKRYWAMDTEKLDAIQDPENETEDEEDND